jgi:hypothetical protein
MCFAGRIARLVQPKKQQAGRARRPTGEQLQAGSRPRRLLPRVSSWTLTERPERELAELTSRTCRDAH